MSKMISTAVLAATFALVSTPAAAATTLTFSNACGGVCGDNQVISQSYGDIANLLDVSYRSVTGFGNTATAGDVRFWGPEYADLDGVAFGTKFGALEIVFKLLDPNAVITFDSVDYASWRSTETSTQLGIFPDGWTGNGPPVRQSMSVVAPGITHATWAPNYSSNGGFIFRFGSDAYYAGIDNLKFTITNVSVSAVPEPTTWLSMILGFGLVGAAARRRPARSAAAIV